MLVVIWRDQSTGYATLSTALHTQELSLTPAGEADLLHAQLDEGAAEGDHLLQGEHLGPGQEGHLLGHAVDAAEVAAVGDREPQVADGAAEAVDQGGSGGHRGFLVEERRRQLPPFHQSSVIIRSRIFCSSSTTSRWRSILMAPLSRSLASSRDSVSGVMASWAASQRLGIVRRTTRGSLPRPDGSWRST